MNASIVADVMYAKPIPLIALAVEEFAMLRTGERVRIDPDGSVTRMKVS